jgi:hypothetical protein
MNDSGFVSGTEMNVDNIFFYEDNCVSSNMPIAFDSSSDNNGSLGDINVGDQSMDTIDQCNNNNNNNTSSSELSTSIVPRQKKHKDPKYTQIKVSVGIDEDLKMLLDLDPSLIDALDGIDNGVLEKAVEPAHNDSQRLSALPPKM